MDGNRQSRQVDVKVPLASMLLVLALLVGNAVFAGLFLWVFVSVIAVAIIGCSVRIVADIYAARG